MKKPVRIGSSDAHWLAAFTHYIRRFVEID